MRIYLTDDQKQAFRSLLRQADLSQALIADRADVRRSSLSAATNPARDKGILDRNWHRVVAVLRELVQARDAELRRNGIVDAVQDLLRQLDRSGVAPVTPRLVSPGSPLSDAALNYIMRPVDRVFEDSIHVPSVPAGIIEGGVQSGKSSLLNRLRGMAEVNKDYDVRFIDCLGIRQALELRTPSPDSLPMAVLREFLHQFRPERDTEPASLPDTGSPVEWAIDELDREGRKAWVERKRAFLMVDALDAVLDIGAPSDYSDLDDEAIRREEQYREPLKESVRGVLSVLSWLRREIAVAGRGQPYEQLSLWIAYGAHPESAAFSSTLHAHSLVTQLTLFDESDVQNILSVHGVRDVETTAKAIHDRFLGQPYLSHQAAYDKAQSDSAGRDLDIARISASRVTFPRYADHWQRIRRRLHPFLATRSGQRDLKRICDGEIDEGKCAVLLARLGVIRPDRRMAPFYGDALRDELGSRS